VVEREEYPDADAAEGALEMPTPEVERWFYARLAQGVDPRARPG
jgi:hypothetical protein